MLAVFLLGLPLSLRLRRAAFGFVDGARRRFLVSTAGNDVHSARCAGRHYGIVAFFYLPDRPADAHWLQPEQREWLTKTLASERDEKRQVTNPSVRATLLDPKMLILAAAFFCVSMSVNGLTLWLPRIIKALGSFSVLQASFCRAFPISARRSPSSSTAVIPTAPASADIILPSPASWAP